MWQAEQVRQRHDGAYPGMSLNVLRRAGPSDQASGAPVRAHHDDQGLEAAIAEGRADLASTRSKHLPSDVPGLHHCRHHRPAKIRATRFVSERYRSLYDMPEGAVVGTS
jgi:hydroxymethylbilane synthase